MLTNTFYKGAGALLYCDDHPQKPGFPFVLLLLETRIDKFTTEIQEEAYIDLGGKRDYTDLNSAHTAARELDEETKHSMYHDLIQDIYLSMCNNQSENGFKNKNGGGYVIYLVKVPYREVPPTVTAEWMSVSVLCNVDTPTLNGHPIAYRLYTFLTMPSFKARLVALSTAFFLNSSSSSSAAAVPSKQ